MTSAYSEPETNYCHDHETNAHWEALARKYPNDMGVATLHALRLGLCLKVERGDLTIDEATEIFENAREQIVQVKRENKRFHDLLDKPPET